MTPGTLELQYMTPDQATHTRYVPTTKGNITNQKKKEKKKETHVYNSVHTLFVMGMSVGLEFETRHAFIEGKIPTPPK